MADRVQLIGPRIVEVRTSLSRRSIGRRVAAGEFPRPIEISTTRIAFVESEIDDWIEARVRERDQTSAREDDLGITDGSPT